ncbi:hypothetical protein Peur_036627 [Populus x canadensis]
MKGSGSFLPRRPKSHNYKNSEVLLPDKSMKAIQIQKQNQNLNEVTAESLGSPNNPRQSTIQSQNRFHASLASKKERRVDLRCLAGEFDSEPESEPSNCPLKDTSLKSHQPLPTPTPPK